MKPLTMAEGLKDGCEGEIGVDYLISGDELMATHQDFSTKTREKLRGFWQ